VICLQADTSDSDESYANDGCIDLDNWDSLENDDDDSTSNRELTQYSAVSHCQYYYVLFSKIK